MAVTVPADATDRATRALEEVLAPDAILVETWASGDATLYLKVRDEEQANWAKEALAEASVRILAADLRDVTPRRPKPMGPRRPGGTVIG